MKAVPELFTARVLLAIVSTFLFVFLFSAGAAFLWHRIDPDYAAQVLVDDHIDKLVKALVLTDGRLAIDRDQLPSFARDPSASMTAFRITRGDATIVLQANPQLLDDPAIPRSTLGRWYGPVHASRRGPVSGGRHVRALGQPLRIEFLSAAAVPLQEIAGLGRTIATILPIVVLPLFAGILATTIFMAQDSGDPAELNDRSDAGARDPAAFSTALPVSRQAGGAQAAPANQIGSVPVAAGRHHTIAMEQFISRAAHMLRMPLAIAMLKLGSIDNEDAREVEAELRTLNTEISRLLHLSRLQGNALGEAKGFDLVCCARAATQVYADEFAKRDIALTCAGEPPLMLRGHECAMRIAIENLLENVLDHAADGRRAEIVVANGPVLSVSDDGPGMPAHLTGVAHLPFQSGRHGEEKAGLGLAIVAQTMAAHGGRISFGTSELGGTRVVLDFTGPALPPMDMNS